MHSWQVIAKFEKKKEKHLQIGRQNINVDFMDMQLVRHLPELFYGHAITLKLLICFNNSSGKYIKIDKFSFIGGAIDFHLFSYLKF